MHIEVIFMVLAAALIGAGAAYVWSRRNFVTVGRELETLRASEARLSQQLEGFNQERADLHASRRQDQDRIIELNRSASVWETKCTQLQTSDASLQSTIESLRATLDERVGVIADLTAKTSLLESEKRLLEHQTKQEREHVEQMRSHAKTEFENLATKILELKSKDFSTQAEKNLDVLLNPLKEKIATFEKKVEDSYAGEAKERFALKSEIARLVEVSDRMIQGTNSLADTLRGDSKVQGDWGEHVVEMLLEAAGLTEGRDFHAQPTHETEDGERVRPDFIVNLPQSKHIIIDSKVSLTAYDAYKHATDDLARQEALAAHLKSVHTHIDDLASKHYHKVKGVNAPDWVFMFMAIEPAYILAMQVDGNLFAKAQKKNIMLVTASTLLASLKTVAYIWRLEKQQRNAVEIAGEAAKLYDKFVGFLEDFEKIGKTFVQGQNLYQGAMGKLKDGPGNIMRKMEGLRELGAAPAKRIKQELLDAAAGDAPALLGSPDEV